jgi:hypothetical protein
MTSEGRRMRYWVGLLFAALLASCDSKTEAPDASASSDAAGPASPPPTPAPAPTASDPDPTKAASLWLDRQTEPRQPGRYAPRDDCRKLPGARAFREKLAAAVQARDADAVAALASPDVRLGFGGDDGRKRLTQKLKANGELLDELARLLPLGCAPSDGGGLTIPWHFAQDMGELDDPYSAMIVTGAQVPLHAAANAGSPARQNVSWDVVTLDKGWFPDKPFQQVTTARGAKGFIATDKLRSMLDYRLLATRTGEGWRITAFLAGD